MFIYYALPLALTAVSMLSLGIFVAFQKIGKRLKTTFFLYTLALFVWSSGQLLALLEKDVPVSLFYVRNYCHTGVIFIPVFFMHFVITLLKEDKERAFAIRLNYLIGIIFLLINNFSSLLVKRVDVFPPVFNLVYVPGELHPYFVGVFLLQICYVNWLLLRRYFTDKKDSIQFKYLVLATFSSQILASPNFLLGYRVQIPILMPWGTYMFPFSIVLFAYAIVKYRLMDIKIAVTRIGIFVLVYSLILGIPFGITYWGKNYLGNLFGEHWYWTPLVVATLLATAGPFIYLYIQKRAEDRLLEEIKRTQEKLFHAEKLAYVGQLASSVVHEVRNPITAIKTFVEYLPDKFRAQDMGFLERFEAIVPREVQRIENLVRELLDLAKPRQMKKKEIKVAEIVNRTLGLLKDNIQLRGIHLENQCLTDDDRILGDEEQIQQVMLNLILNALDAMQKGGTLSVKVSREDNRIMAAVRDTGCGISPEALKLLFTPFHTTKKNGVGLGLIVTQEIVKQHGGEIQVQSAPGRGTQFSIILPAMKK